MIAVVWEHVSRRSDDRCSYSARCPFRPTWVVQLPWTHRLACWWHRPRR